VKIVRDSKGAIFVHTGSQVASGREKEGGGQCSLWYDDMWERARRKKETDEARPEG
jgi:hypothetical protein